MIDIATEEIKLLGKASPDIPGRPHVSTLIRWATRGVKGVKLETTVIGGRRYTSIEAIRRFITRLNVSDTSGSLSSQKSPQDNQVGEELDKVGIK